VYFTDLAYIHDAGFGRFARQAAPEVAAILRRHGIRRGHVVEVGCGSGVAARALVERGYEVSGYDISKAMIRLARRRAPDATFRVGSIESLAVPACDAVVSIGEVVTYVSGGLPVLKRFFHRTFDALRPGGILIFDFIVSARGRTFPPKTLKGRSWRFEASASFNQSTHVLTRRIDMQRDIDGRVRRSSETHRVRVYSRAAMVRALKQAGFVSTTTNRSLGRVALLSGDLAVVARKGDHV
jgi:SAM-dependent methyltransferase